MTKLKANDKLILVVSALLLINQFRHQVDADLVLLIDLVNYTNPTGRLHTGQCCDTYLYQNVCPTMPQRCDVGIRICIDNADNSHAASDSEECMYGSQYLNGVRDLNTFDFKQANQQAMLPFIFTIKWNRPILPRFLLKFFAADDSSDKAFVQKSLREKLIDCYSVDFNSDMRIRPGGGLSSELTWIDYMSVMGSLSHPTFKT